MSSFTLPVQATQALTSSGVALNTETVVVGGKTYTFQTVLTNVDGNVLIGASAAASLQNLFDAINLTATAGLAGTTYAAAMTRNAQVVASSVTATILTVKAKCAGTIGNLIPSTETLTNFAWGAALLAGGTGDVGDAIRLMLAEEQMNGNVAQLLKSMFTASA